MKKKLLVAVIVCSVICGCKKQPETPISTQEPIPQIILDADFGSSTDDVFALKLLCRYMDSNRCKLIGVICDRAGNQNTQITKVLLTYYNHPDIPLGQEVVYRDKARVFIDYCDSNNWDSITSNWREKSVWHNSLTTKEANSIVADGCELYRKLLSESDDNSVTIVCIGFLTTLSRLLDSQADSISNESGVELVSKKVKKIYIMGTHFSKDNFVGKMGYNLGELDGNEPSVSPKYAHNVFCKLPHNVEVIFSPDHMGEFLGRYEHSEVIEDYAKRGDTLDPIYKIYCSTEEDPYQYLWDILPVIECVEGDSLFALSERGKVSVNLDYSRKNNGWIDNSQILFSQDSSGNYRFQESFSIKKLKRMAEILSQYLNIQE